MAKRRGAIGVFALWIAAALSALALSALRLARGRLAAARDAAAAAQSIHLAGAAAVLDASLEFPADAGHQWSTGATRETAFRPTGETIVWICDVATSGPRRQIEVDWRRSARGWRAVAWRER